MKRKLGEQKKSNNNHNNEKHLHNISVRQWSTPHYHQWDTIMLNRRGTKTTHKIPTKNRFTFGRELRKIVACIENHRTIFISKAREKIRIDNAKRKEKNTNDKTLNMANVWGNIVTESTTNATREQVREGGLTERTSFTGICKHFDRECVACISKQCFNTHKNGAFTKPNWFNVIHLTVFTCFWWILNKEHQKLCKESEIYFVRFFELHTCFCFCSEPGNYSRASDFFHQNKS